MIGYICSKSEQFEKDGLYVCSIYAWVLSLSLTYIEHISAVVVGEERIKH